MCRSFHTDYMSMHTILEAVSVLVTSNAALLSNVENVQKAVYDRGS